MCLHRKPWKGLKRHLLAESESTSLVSQNHSVFASNFEIIQSNLD